MEVHWEIALLGRLAVTPAGGTAMLHFPNQKAGALLAYLACQAPEAVPRSRVATALWPTVPPSDGLRRLRVTLAALRRSTGAGRPALVIGDRTALRLAPECRVDATDFKAAVRAAAQARDPDLEMAALQSALDHFGGTLLPGFYEDWVLEERRWLEERHLSALARLVDLFEAAGQTALARSYAQRLVTLDPDDADAVTRLNRLDRLAKLEPAASGANSRVSTPIAPPVDYRADASGAGAVVPLMAWMASPENRLLTLVGPRDAPSTRHALELAAGLKPWFPGGIVFVPLAAGSDTRQLGRDWSQRFESAIHFGRDGGERRRLWVLDRLEPTPGTIGVIATLLGRFPGLCCLVTGSAALGLPGELVFHWPAVRTSLSETELSATAAPFVPQPKATGLASAASRIEATDPWPS